MMMKRKKKRRSFKMNSQPQLLYLKLRFKRLLPWQQQDCSEHQLPPQCKFNLLPPLIKWHLRLTARKIVKTSFSSSSFLKSMI
jgi:hypothetical protein